MSMVEIVARAMFPGAWIDAPTTSLKPMWQDEMRTISLHAARAAILALRTPTDEMVHAGWMASVHEGAISDIFEAMLDAALEVKS